MFKKTIVTLKCNIDVHKNIDGSRNNAEVKEAGYK